MYRFLSIGLVFLFWTARAAADEGIEIYSAPAPERMRNVGQATPASTTESRTPSAPGAPVPPVVSIPLDNTGIADWSFLNPRNPRRIPDGGPNAAGIEFSNLTADRIFEVTTNVTVRPTDTVTAPFPPGLISTIYAALTDDPQLTGPNAAPQPAETRQEYEQRLIRQAIASSPSLDGSLRHVLALELAQRELAAAAAAEKKARDAYAEAVAKGTAAAVSAAKIDVERAETVRVQKEKTVSDLVDTADTRKPLMDLLEKKATARRSAYRGSRRQKPPADQILETLDDAVAALNDLSGERSLLLQAQTALRDVELRDCAPGTAGAINCVAVVYVHPNGAATFPHQVLLQQADGEALAKFNVRFFHEDETPANRTAYAVSEKLASKKVPPPKSVATLSATATIGGLLDPFYESRKDSRNCPILCPGKPYGDAHKTHYTGSGKIDIKQTFGNLLDGQVTLGYKEGDLGGPAATQTIKLSQYQFNIYSKTGLAFALGNFRFASPSKSIAITERGEGFRFNFRNYALSHITKRESTDGVADRANRDSESWVVEANNLSVSGKFIRALNLIYVKGNDRKPMETKKNAVTGLDEQFFTAHDYTALGGQAGFTMPMQVFGTLSYYRSTRRAERREVACGTVFEVCDGRGDVWLATATWPISVDQKGTTTRMATLTAGAGSGDDPNTPNKDESYIGENPALAVDQIFLAGLATSISGRPYVSYIDPMTNVIYMDPERLRQYQLEDSGPAGLGPGLTGKRYLGIQYVDKNFSLLETLARTFFQVPKDDIVSKSTTVTLNQYRLRAPFLGDRSAGHELDIEFTAETPRGVTVSLKGGYYWPGSAVKTIVTGNVWTMSSLISISL